jgi:hypothetical protein
MPAAINAPASGGATIPAWVQDLIQLLRDWRREVELVAEGRFIGSFPVSLLGAEPADVVMEDRVVGRITHSVADDGSDDLVGRFLARLAGNSSGESPAPAGRSESALPGPDPSDADARRRVGEQPAFERLPAFFLSDGVLPDVGAFDYAGLLVEQQLLDEAAVAAHAAAVAAKDFLLPNIDKALDHPEGNKAIQAWGALEEAYNIALGAVQTGAWIAAHAAPPTFEVTADPKTGAISVANGADAGAAKLNGWLERWKATIAPGDAALGATVVDVANDLLLAKNALKLGTAGLEALSKALTPEAPEGLPDVAGARPDPSPEVPAPAPPVAPRPTQAESENAPSSDEKNVGAADKPIDPGAPNRGLIFVSENLGKPRSSAMKAARDFEAATEGAYSDVATQQRQVPALRYNNPNPKGAPYVKFDGYRRLENGKIELIDAKTRIVPFETAEGPYISKGVREGLARQSRALAQNSGYVGVIELPTSGAAAEARAVLKTLGIENLTARVRPPE